MPNNPFQWDPSVGQYRAPNGRFVPRETIRRVIDDILDREAREVEQLARQLRSGSITLEDWRSRMRSAIKSIHLYSAAAARGGWAQISQVQFGQLGRVIRSEYAYLEKFARGISDRSVPLDAFFIDRAQQYAQAGRDTYHQIEQRVMSDAGFETYENIIDTAAENCHGANSCTEQTARGRVPIGELIPIGRRRCLRKCRCHLKYYR